MTRFIPAAFAIALLAGPALAQTAVPPGAAARAGATVVREGGNTGDANDVIIAPGATGAETYQSDSAAGGNAAQPERAVPQGSGGGSR